MKIYIYIYTYQCKYPVKNDTFGAQCIANDNKYEDSVRNQSSELDYTLNIAFGQHL